MSSQNTWLTGSVTQLLLAGLVGALSFFVWKLYNARVVFYQLKKAGMPMPPWHPVFGHLLILPEILEQLPNGSQQGYMFSILARDFPESDSLFYIDLWPFSGPILIVCTPGYAYQANQEYDFPKPDSLLPFFRPITGGLGMFMMNGEEHKASRALFNPGFADSVIFQNASVIVEQAEIYVGLLREHAKKGDMFSLDEMTCSYMMDVIGVVTLDAHLNSQTSYNALASTMRNQINNQIREEELNPFKRYNPLHPVVEWYRGRKMDQYISAELDKRYQEWRNASSAPKTKSVIDLALSGYMQNRTAGETLDPEFKKWACAQIRLFLFVGHDSTAATIVYSLYLLSKYPEAMKRVRKEHEEVFGTDVSRLPETIKANPHLTNRLPFTTAVIKETLRLFPPAASFRGGQPNSPLRHPDSDNPIKYQTSSVGVWIVHDALHRHPSYWPEPHSFIPDRWLVESSHPLYPTSKWAWRPFEHGSRNCPGQTLVMLDIKVTLAMVVREFNVRDAYEEWDKLMGSKGLKTVQGERAYQVSKGSLHPADGFPCRVSIRKPTS